MSLEYRSHDRHRFENDFQAREKEIAAVLNVSSPLSPKSPTGQPPQDKRVRREIANGNERRRMQCINNGFTSLRSLIPQIEGEKLSKAAILQQSIDYITNLEKEKSHIKLQLEKTTRRLAELGQDKMTVDSYTPPPKRKKRDTESSDEGMGSLSDASEDGGNDLRQKNEGLKHQLEKEKQRADALDEENHFLRKLIGQKQLTEPPQPITLVTTLPPQETRMDVMSPHLNYTPPLRQDEIMEYSSSVSAPPVSITPDYIKHEAVLVDATNHQSLEQTPSSYYIVSSNPNPMVGTAYSAAPNTNTSSSLRTSSLSELTQQALSESEVLLNYAHRDHPRRRRHQAQLERQRVEEEERQEMEEMQQRRQESLASAIVSNSRHSVHNLDLLAEAAKQVKDDRHSHPAISSSMPIQISHPVMYKTSEDISRVSINNGDNVVCGIQDRLSPPSNSSSVSVLSSSHLSSSQLSPLTTHQYSTVSSSYSDHLSTHVPIIVTANITDAHRRAKFSDKFPIASHLLHLNNQSSNPSYSRPNVIVQQNL